jgi:hypothetical protein
MKTLEKNKNELICKNKKNIMHPIYLDEVNPEPLITLEMVEKNKNSFSFEKPNRKAAIFNI